jgi:phage head maturation protease
MQIRLAAPAAGIRADRLARTISGPVVPWDVYAAVSTGQVVAFAPGSVILGERSKLVLDHDPAQPVAVFVNATDTGEWLEATFRVPPGPAGDQVLADAQEGLRDGFSVGVDVIGSEDRPEGTYVTVARGRHVALLSEPAFDAARVASVTAAAPEPPAPTEGEPAVSDVPTPIAVTFAGPLAVTTIATDDLPGGGGDDSDLATPAAGAVIPTVAGARAPVPLAASAARVTDPYPYSVPQHLGGPSFVMDAYKSTEDPGSVEADRWRRSLVMLSDPAVIRAGMARFSNALPPNIAAATGTTVTDPGLVPDRWLPERYVPLRGAKAPLYTALSKYPTADFTTLQVPRTVAETGLSGRPTDEVTPITPGDITTDNDSITIDEVEGAYMFSRKLLLGSNPQIDAIALAALDRAWLADVETRAVAYFQGANVSTAVGATYADGAEYVATLRGQMAAMAASTLYQATAIIPASKEYIAVAEADDSTGRPLLPYGPQMNAPGVSGEGYATVSVQGVPAYPGPYMPANKTFLLDQSLDAAVCFATPVMNFRLEWTSDPTGGNVKVLKLVKYSGVGFWSQYIGGVVLMTNSTPIAAEAGTGSADSGTSRKR